MQTAPSSGWYALGLRLIASGIIHLAAAIDRKAPEPWPLEPAPDSRGADDSLLDARSRAARGF